MEDNRDKLVDDLNSILKDNFDYVPLYKVRNIVDELIEEGWKFDYEVLGITNTDIEIIKKALVEYEENHYETEDDEWQKIINNLIEYFLKK